MSGAVGVGVVGGGVQQQEGPVTGRCGGGAVGCAPTGVWGCWEWMVLVVGACTGFCSSATWPQTRHTQQSPTHITNLHPYNQPPSTHPTHPPNPPFSDLLSPDSAGDLAVLPHGRVTPELYCLLRVLCVSEQEFGSWAALADVLKPPPQQQPTTTSGGTAAAAAAAAAGGPHTLGGVPLSQLLSGGGGNDDNDDDGGGEAQQHAVATRFQEVAIGGAAAAAGGLWSGGMARALTAAVRERDSRYPAGSALERDRRRLGDGALTADRSEHAAAVRGALQLRVAERTVLQQAVEAASGLVETLSC